MGGGGGVRGAYLGSRDESAGVTREVEADALIGGCGAFEGGEDLARVAHIPAVDLPITARGGEEIDAVVRKAHLCMQI